MNWQYICFFEIPACRQMATGWCLHNGHKSTLSAFPFGSLHVGVKHIRFKGQFEPRLLAISRMLLHGSNITEKWQSKRILPNRPCLRVKLYVCKVQGSQISSQRGTHKVVKKHAHGNWSQNHSVACSFPFPGVSHHTWRSLCMDKNVDLRYISGFGFKLMGRSSVCGWWLVVQAEVCLSFLPKTSALWSVCCSWSCRGQTLTLDLQTIGLKLPCSQPNNLPLSSLPSLRMLAGNSKLLGPFWKKEWSMALYLLFTRSWQIISSNLQVQRNMSFPLSVISKLSWLSLIRSLRDTRGGW